MSSNPPSIFASVNRWAFPLAGLLVVGPLAAWPLASLRAPDGGWDTTPLMSSAPVVGLLAGVGALVLAGLWGIVTAMVTTVRYGLFTTGLALAWATWSTGTMDLIMRTEDAAAHYWRLPVEGAVFGVLAVVFAALIAGMGKQPATRRRTDGEGESGEAAIVNGFLRGLSSLIASFRRDSETSVGHRALVVVTAAAVGAIVAYLLAVESLKGQTFAAATFGALLGATAGEIAGSSGAGESRRAPVALFFLAATVLAIAGPVAAMGVHSGASGVAEAATTAKLLAISRPLPLDWIAGAFVGVPIGLTWADSLVDRGHKA